MTDLRKAAEQRIGMERPERGSVGFQEALGLADWLDAFNNGEQYAVTKSAAELRRLHEENEALRQALAQPEQEPVAQLQEEQFGRGQVLWFIKPADKTMLYTAPLKREWQTLTGNEAKDFYEKYTDKEQLIYAIDKFLEEKNT